MFIRLTDAKSNVNMLLSVREILVVKDYIVNGTPIENANTVVMTRPINGEEGVTHNYFVSETLTEIESLIETALELSF